MTNEIAQGLVAFLGGFAVASVLFVHRLGTVSGERDFAQMEVRHLRQHLEDAERLVGELTRGKP